MIISVKTNISKNRSLQMTRCILCMLFYSACTDPSAHTYRVIIDEREPESRFTLDPPIATQPDLGILENTQADLSEDPEDMEISPREDALNEATTEEGHSFREHTEHTEPVECLEDRHCTRVAPDRCIGDQLLTSQAFCREQRCIYEDDIISCVAQDRICRNSQCIEPSLLDDSAQIDNPSSQENSSNIPTIGDLVMSEIMYNPIHASDSIAEYIELYNTSPRDLDLSTCLIRDSGDTSSELGVISLEPQSYLLVAKSPQPSLFDQEDIEATFHFGLNNDGDTIQIICDEEIIDEVSYSEARGFPEALGASLQLDVRTLNAQSNDTSESWCLTNTEYMGTDRGTPGRANHECHILSDSCEEQSTMTLNQEGTYIGDLTEASDQFTPTCGVNHQGKDLLYRIIAPRDTMICADTRGSAELSSFLTDTVLSVRTECSQEHSELTCQDDHHESFDAQVQWRATANTPYYLIVDSYSPLFAERFELHLTFDDCIP